MTKQEEIREGIWERIGDCLISIGCGEEGCIHAETKALEAQETCLESILSYLHSQGVVIKVERELPENPHIITIEKVSKSYNITLSRNALEVIMLHSLKNEGFEEALETMLRAGYVAVEPLIRR